MENMNISNFKGIMPKLNFNSLQNFSLRNDSSAKFPNVSSTIAMKISHLQNQNIPKLSVPLVEEPNNTKIEVAQQTPIKPQILLILGKTKALNGQHIPIALKVEEKMNNSKMEMKYHVCTDACKNGNHVYANGEKWLVCTEACKSKM